MKYAFFDTPICLLVIIDWLKMKINFNQILIFKQFTF